jgi:hypothetical protein
VQVQSDAALIEPDGTVSVLSARAPLPPLFGAAVGVWNDQILVIGSDCTSVTQPDSNAAPGCAPATEHAAIYDLVSQRWQRLDLPGELVAAQPSVVALPIGTRILGVTPDGTAIVMKTESVSIIRSNSVVGSLWSYHFDSDTWTRLPDPPQPGRGICLSGQTVVSLSLDYTVDGVVYPEEPKDNPFRENGRDGWTNPTLWTIVPDGPDGTATWQRTGPVTTFPTPPNQSFPVLACGPDAIFLYDPDNAQSLQSFDLPEGV